MIERLKVKGRAKTQPSLDGLVDICAQLHQRRYHIRLSIQSGHMQRSKPILAGSVHVGAALNQHLPRQTPKDTFARGKNWTELAGLATSENEST